MPGCEPRAVSEVRNHPGLLIYWNFMQRQLATIDNVVEKTEQTLTVFEEGKLLGFSQKKKTSTHIG